MKSILDRFYFAKIVVDFKIFKKLIKQLAILWDYLHIGPLHFTDGYEERRLFLKPVISFRISSLSIYGADDRSAEEGHQRICINHASRAD